MPYLFSPTTNALLTIKRLNDTETKVILKMTVCDFIAIYTITPYSIYRSRWIFIFPRRRFILYIGKYYSGKIFHGLVSTPRPPDALITDSCDIHYIIRYCSLISDAQNVSDCVHFNIIQRCI